MPIRPFQNELNKTKSLSQLIRIDYMSFQQKRKKRRKGHQLHDFFCCYTNLSEGLEPSQVHSQYIGFIFYSKLKDLYAFKTKETKIQYQYIADKLFQQYMITIQQVHYRKLYQNGQWKESSKFQTYQQNEKICASVKHSQSAKCYHN